MCAGLVEQYHVYTHTDGSQPLPSFTHMPFAEVSCAALVKMCPAVSLGISFQAQLSQVTAHLFITFGGKH